MILKFDWNGRKMCQLLLLFSFSQKNVHYWKFTYSMVCASAEQAILRKPYS